MPACFRPNEKDEEDGWREPPGYLGEAVRRAKLIPSRANSDKPLHSVDRRTVERQTVDCRTDDCRTDGRKTRE
jgi:hypothetical protein